MLPTRRALVFDTPQRSAKRARTTTPSSGRMTIPKSLLPEMKQFLSPLTGASTDRAGSSVPQDMSQGDESTQFVGAKFRAKRLRVNYNFTSVNNIVRIAVVIPKDPSDIATSSFLLANETTPIDTTRYTVLFERFIPNDASLKYGTFDVPMNILVELDPTGTFVRKNNILISAHSSSLGSTVRLNVSYCLWYTDH